MAVGCFEEGQLHEDNVLSKRARRGNEALLIENIWIETVFRCFQLAQDSYTDLEYS